MLNVRKQGWRRDGKVSMKVSTDPKDRHKKQGKNREPIMLRLESVFSS